MSKLLNISEASSIAIHCMVLIANCDEIVNAQTISETFGLSRNHSAKVLQLLAKHNYLESSRGPQGGFKLKVDPKKISILKIFELVEGQIDTGNCIHGVENCVFSECIYGNFGAKLNQQFKEYFGKRMLSDIIIKKKYKGNMRKSQTFK